jgi:hypothetical protein
MEASVGEALAEPQAGVEICTRCGSFADLAPFWGARLCAACIDRKASSFREPITLRSLISGTFALPLRVWLSAALVHLVSPVL